MKLIPFCRLLLLAVSCHLALPLFSQDRSMTTDELLDQMNAESRRQGVIRTIPNGFEVVNGQQLVKLFDRWTPNREQVWRKQGGSGSGAIGPLFQSEDKQCALIYDWINQATPSGLHRRWIMSNLISIFEGRTDFRFEDYVTVISGKTPKKNFNADTVFLHDIPMKPQELNGVTYTHCIRMYLFRNYRVMPIFHWFFTDEGFVPKEYYMDKLRRKVWYKD